MFERPSDDWAVLAARKLRKVVVDEMKVRSPWSESGWAGEFRKLAKACDGDHKEIEKTLDWFCVNWRKLTGKYYSASAFCSPKAYTMFVEMRRSGGKDAPPAERSPELTQVFADIEGEGLSWPGGEPEGFEEFVSGVYEDSKRMITLLREARRSEDPDVKYLARELLADLCDDAADAAVRWVRWVSNDVEGWPGWYGKLGKYHAFRPDSDFFTKFVREWGRGRVTFQGIKDFIQACKERWRS